MALFPSREECIELHCVSSNRISCAQNRIAWLATARKEVYELCIPLTSCLALRIYCRLIELSLESISSHFEGITRTSKLIKAPQRPFSQLSFVRYSPCCCCCLLFSLNWLLRRASREEKERESGVGGECRGRGALGVALSWHFCRIFE